MSTESAKAATQTTAFIGLGSNLGDRQRHIRLSLQEIAAYDDILVDRVSTLHETDAVGGPEQPRFLNAVARIQTTLPPRTLLERMLSIEQRHGRWRTGPNTPRTLDLDLLLFGDHTIDEPGLTVPHPRMWKREFVLKPLAELVGREHLETLRRRFTCTST